MSDAVEEFITLHQDIEKEASYAKSILLRGSLPGAATGGITGAMVAKPEERLESALVGAGAGALLGSGGAALHDLPVHLVRRQAAKGLKSTDPNDVEQARRLLAGEPFSRAMPKVPPNVDPDQRLLNYGELKRFGLDPVETGALAGGIGGSLATIPYLRRRKEQAKMDKESMDKEAIWEAIKRVAQGPTAKAIGGAVAGGAKRTGNLVARVGEKALGAGATLGLMYGGTAAIQSATEAVNRSRGYKHMIEVNPDLAEGDFDDEQVKGMYNLLHKAAPTFAQNPYVSGSFVRRTESAGKFVDPQMISNLAGAEAKMRAVEGAPMSQAAGALKLLNDASQAGL